VTETSSGGCLCGAVRYRLSAPPISFYVCHCTECQTRSGSAFDLTMIVQTASLTLESGSPAEFQYTLPSGNVDRGRFCASCVTRLWHEPEALPQIRGLCSGTLDDRSRYAPFGDVWTRSAHPWVRLTSGPHFETMPDDPLALVRAWQERQRGD